jgi:single-strand DNA-binding protein
MSLRGHKSRQIGPLFLRKRRSASRYAKRSRGASLPSSFERVARRRFSRVRRGQVTPRMPRSMQIMKRSSLEPLPCLSGHTLRANFVALRHCAALLSGLLSQSEFGPLLQNARLGNGGLQMIWNTNQFPMQAASWEPGRSLGLRQGVTRSIREFNLGDFTMYQNRISLIGFLGQNASTHTANNASFTVLSLATKSSYKDKKTGEYKGHTEWHRCIVWGRLAEYAKTLTKGSHLSVEGELRSHEQTSKKTNAKQRVWEVRVSSILKLDRGEKVAPEEADDSTPDVDQDVPE